MDTYEKKLALAKEALDSGSYDKETIEYIFPELKENEDERIRKALMQNLKERFGTKGSMGEGLDMPDVLAWLEKQSEQKSADKVEPKFKVGDWVVRGDTIAQIIDVQEQYYIGIDTNDNDFTSSKFLSDDKIHLWTIKDVKPGDVLSYRDGQWIFIYKGIVTEDTFKYYALLSEKGITVNDAAFSLLTSCIIPATKEQRDTLMKVMADAGYEWDAENKQLRKIEQNSAWSEEDEMFVHGLIRGLAAKKDIHGHTTFSSDCIDITKTINWLKSLRDRYTWKPSDEQIGVIESSNK